ncbi:zinc finger protein 488-like [Tachypleus tridentatus]|uniref:zinc finger protein 488-like n=1 Tax=Tachypleus tridentatus TaxID=6853 RepID=UPI003FCF64E5
MILSQRMGEPILSVVTQQPIATGTLIGPLPFRTGSVDPLALLIWRCQDVKQSSSKNVIKVNPQDTVDNGQIVDWILHVQPARDLEEQNIEVVARGGQFYFRAMKNIHEGHELTAWFGDDLAEILRLPTVPSTVLEEGKRYFCVLCHHIFIHPYPVIGHLMYWCDKRNCVKNSITPSNLSTTAFSDPLTSKQTKPRVKSFDIASLTANSNDSDKDIVKSGACGLEKRNEHTKRDHSNDNDPPINVQSGVKRKETLNYPEETIKNKKRQKTTEEQAHLFASSQSITRYDSSSPELLSFSNLELSSSRRTPGRKISSIPSNNNVINVTSRDVSNPATTLSAFKKVNKPGSASVSTSSPFSTMDSSFYTTSPTCEIFSKHLVPSLVPGLSVNLPNLTSHPSGMTSTTLSMFRSIQSQTLSSSDNMNSAFSPTTKLSPSALDPRGVCPLRLGDLKLQGIRRESVDTSSLLSSSLQRMQLHGFAVSPTKYFPTILNSNIPSTKTITPSLLSYLPPSLAALSFPTHNFCAKCNASFRMTSDLVYHMRSHHKRETDPVKKKREEKLKCNICNESFRERHHLTRHMTSH